MYGEGIRHRGYLRKTWCDSVKKDIKFLSVPRGGKDSEQMEE